MFWRRKKPTKELFTYESCNFRSSFRVYPSPEEPISLLINGRNVIVVDIGAGGISFTNKGFKVGDVLKAIITLPLKDIQVETEISIVRVSDEGTAHCAFKGIRAEDSEIIHKYMLEKQKQELRERRRNTDVVEVPQ